MNRLFVPAALALLLGAGCDEDPQRDGDTGDDCVGAKCDLPENEETDQCLLRQSEVLESSRRAFTEDYVRWACADVEGVNTVGQDDRGQEYCEYYAIFQPPGDREAVDLGRPLSAERGDVSDNAICVGEEAGKDCRISLTEDELFDLEDDPSAVVGACVFTAWHSDVPGPLPTCGAGQSACPEVMGFPLTDEFFQMKLETNSNATASDTVQFCVDMAAKGRVPIPEDLNDPNDPFTEPFYRGCRVSAFFNLEWRRSDPAICAVANRMIECGCGIEGVAPEELGGHVVPPQPNADGTVSFRGFSLGSWGGEDSLPAGCEYQDTGDGSNTIVTCDLTAADVIENLSDPKEACRNVYGGQVVAHAAIPVEQVSCTPPSTPLGATCGAMPWNIGREG